MTLWRDFWRHYSTFEHFLQQRISVSSYGVRIFATLANTKCIFSFFKNVSLMVFRPTLQQFWALFASSQGVFPCSSLYPKRLEVYVQQVCWTSPSSLSSWVREGEVSSTGRRILKGVSAGRTSMLINIVIVIIVGQGGTGIFEGKADSEGCIRRSKKYVDHHRHRHHRGSGRDRYHWMEGGLWRVYP